MLRTFRALEAWSIGTSKPGESRTPLPVGTHEVRYDGTMASWCSGSIVLRHYGTVWLWSGVAWHGMVWYGMAWHGMVRHGMVWYGMAWHGMAWHGVLQIFSHPPACGMVQHLSSRTEKLSCRRTSVPCDSHMRPSTSAMAAKSPLNPAKLYQNRGGALDEAPTQV